jgi:hypothetical protein
MFKLQAITLTHLFQFFVIGAVIISFYMLMVHVYNKAYRDISCWRFPMLLAILLESFVI